MRYIVLIVMAVCGCVRIMAETSVPQNLVGLNTIKYSDSPQIILAKIIDQYTYRLTDGTELYLAECQGQDIIIHTREKKDELDSTLIMEEQPYIISVDVDTFSTYDRGYVFPSDIELKQPINFNNIVSLQKQVGVSKIEVGKVYLFLVQPTELWDELIELFPYSMAYHYYDVYEKKEKFFSYNKDSVSKRLKNCKQRSFRALNLVGEKVYPIDLKIYNKCLK